MAQPIYAIEYLGALEVTAGIEYPTADILSSFTGATVVKLDASTIIDNKYQSYPTRVAIDGGPMFHIRDGDESYLETGKIYTFDVDCRVIVGKYRTIV